MYVVYLIECKRCISSFAYAGSAKTAFREGLNNYKSAYHNFGNPFFNNKRTKGLKLQKFHTQLLRKVILE